MLITQGALVKVTDNMILSSLKETQGGLHSYEGEALGFEPRHG